MSLQASGKKIVLVCFFSWTMIIFFSMFMLSSVIHAEEETDSAFSKEDQRQKKIYSRYLSIVEKNPRRGTAFDRVYGYHVEQGTLADFTKSLNEKTKKQPGDGKTWTIIGLVESQRGNDAQAINAFRLAEKVLKDDPIISYYLSQSLVLVGQTDKAIQALERAIEKKPARNDLLNIFKSLGKLHQQANRHDEAMKVWSRLEKLFPENQRVQEQIAIYLEDDSQFEEALGRYEKLSKNAKDQYQKVVFKVKSAELKLRLGKKDSAITDFESLMGQLKPGSWLHRDVRNRVESIFMRTEDLSGLSQYYKNWIKKHPQDIDAISRLGSTLSKQGRSPEALAQYRQAIKLAPSTVKFRESLIEELIYIQKIPEAIKEYEKLDKIKSNDIEILRDWGLLVLDNKAKAKKERQKEVKAIWKELEKANEKDPVILSQIADWFRQADLKEEAIALYQKSIDLSPDSPQYYEYLGEYYHKLERKEDALKTWSLLIKGENRTPRNLIRLAEVLGGFGYKKESLKFWKEASQKDLDFPEFVRHAQLLRENKQIKESLAELDKALKVADRSEDIQRVLQEQILCYQESGTLKEEIQKLGEILKTEKGNVSENWAKMALYHEASNDSSKAIKAITTSLKLEKDNVTTLTTAARLYESAGDLTTAVDTYTHLLETDRKYKTEYLNKIASLQMQLGHIEKSLKTARDLIAASPGNPEGYQFYADLCFQIGRDKEGINALRRSVRANPGEIGTLHSLAGVLAEQFKTGEAIEIYWRTFEKSDDLTDRLEIISKLTGLYVRRNRTDQLFDRLNRMKNEQKDKREMSLCLAQAHRSTGDFGSARKTLEDMLSENTKDTQLLQQLISLSENEDNLESAIKFQKRFNEVAPSKEGKMHLAKLQLQTGQTTEAELIWTELLENEDNPDKLLQGVDTLISQGKKELAEKMLKKVLYKDPNNWDLKYRKLVLAIFNDKKEEIKTVCEEILAMNLSHEELSFSQKKQQKQIMKMRKTQSSRYRSYQPSPAFFQRQTATGMIRNLKKNHENARNRSRNRYGSRGGFVSFGSFGHSSRGGYSRPTYWIPGDFGTLKVAALTLLYDDAKGKKKGKEFVKAYQLKIEKPNATNQEWMDWCYVNLAIDDFKNNQFKNVIHALSVVSKQSTLPYKVLYLYALTGSGRTHFGGSPEERTRKDRKPYDKKEVDHILACYKEILRVKPEWMQSNFILQVMSELERSGRKKEADELYQDTIQAANTPQLIQKTIQLAVMQEDGDALFTLIRKYDSLSQNKNPYAQQYLYQFMQLLGKAKAKGDSDLVHKFVELSLETISKQHLNKSNRRSHYQPSLTQSYQRAMHVTIYGSNNRNQHVQINYPFMNSHLNQTVVQLLRNCYEAYKTEDNVPELVKLIQDQIKKSEMKINLKMALAAIHWWNEEKEEAIETIKEVIKENPENVSLKLEYAQLLFREGNQEDALATLDSIEVLDFNILKERELIALQLAIQSNDVDRAKKAAERLFGLRLNNNTQIQLASVMHQLGMNEMGDAVLARIRRSAGNNVNTLSQLMSRYKQQGKVEIASEIAMQIIRSRNFSSRNRNNSDHYYQSAIKILTQAGHLQKLIKTTEKQLDQSPKSNKIMMKLISYYAAVGDHKKIKKLQEKMLKTQSSNPQMIYQMAKSAAAGNNHKYAADLYLIVLKKNPELLANDFYQVRRTFTKAQKNKELMESLLKMDLKKFRHYYYLVDIINNNNSRSGSKDIKKESMKLLKKIMEAYPDQQLDILGRIHRQEVWGYPEMYDLVKNTLMNSKINLNNNPWYGLNRIMSYSSSGKVNGLATRLISMADKQKDKAELIKIIEKRVKDEKDWLGGKGLLAILYLREKKLEEAKKIIVELQENKKIPMGNQARWLLAQELHDFEELHPIAIDLYLANEKSKTNTNQNQFMYRSTRGLLELYIKRDEKEKAAELLLKLEKEPPRQQHNASYTAYQTIQTKMQVSTQFTKLGYHHEALRILSELSENQTLFITASQFGGGNYKKQIKASIAKAIESIDGDVLALILKDQLKKQSEPAATKNKNDKDKKNKAGKKSDSSDNNVLSSLPFDLIWVIQPTELSKSRVESTFFNIFKKNKFDDKKKKEIQSLLKQLKEKSKNQKSIGLIDVLISYHMDKKTFTLDELNETKDYLLAEITELSKTTLPEDRKKKLNKKQIRIKKQKTDYLLSLWLISRIASENKETEKWGDKLSSQIILIAKENLEQKWVLAFLNESAIRNIKQGDKDSAEKNWSEMLDMILAPPQKKKNKVSNLKRDDRILFSFLENRFLEKQFYLSSVSSFFKDVIPLIITGQVPTQKSTGSITKAVTSAVKKSLAAGKSKKKKTKKSLITTEQFEKAMQIAKIAAINGMVDLSLKAVKKSLSDGRPIIANTIQLGSNIYSGRSRFSRNNAQSKSITILVEQHISELSELWKKHKFLKKKVTETLIHVVFPENRPNQIILYQRPFTRTASVSRSRISSSHSVARILLEWASDSEQLDQIADIAKTRQKHINFNIESVLFLTELAMLKKDYALANSQLKSLNSKISLNTMKQANEMICQIAFPALKIQETSDTALKVVKQAISNLSKGNEIEPVSSYLLILAVNQMLHKQEKEAFETLKQYLTTNTKQNNRYSGDYGLFLRRKQLIKVTEILIHSSMFKETLEYMGELSDFRLQNYGPAPIDNVVATLSRKLSAMPAEEKYQVLMDWVFPKHQLKLVRELAFNTPLETPPNLFFEKKIKGGEINLPSRGFNDPSKLFFSSSLLLVKTAKELNRIPDLKKKINALSKNNSMENLEIIERMKLLTLITEGKNKEARNEIELLISKIKAGIPKVKIGNQNYKSDKSAEFAVVLACLKSPELRDSCQSLLDVLEYNAFRFSLREMMVQTRYVQFLLSSLEQKRKISKSTDIALWSPGSHKIAALNFGGTSHPVWISQNEHLSHIAGPQIDHLFFNYPLTGDFEFSVDSLNDRWSEGHVSYNGLTYQMEGGQKRGEVWGVGRHGSSILPVKKLGHNQFNKHTLHVSNKSVKFLMNDELFHEDKSPGSNTPWLAVYCENACKSYFRNIKLTGNPVIPSEVKMSQGDRLDGWIGSFHGEKIKERVSAFSNQSQPNSHSQKKLPDVWDCEEGIIRGKKTEKNSHYHSLQSWLYYNRPLIVKDKVRYEFFYDPGKIQTHPTIGRYALILAEDGVKLHWVTDKQDYDWSGLFSDNAVSVKEFQKGKEKLPLKSGEWNQVELEVLENHVQLKLNNTLIYELPIQFLNQNIFGLFHYKDLTESKVRNVVLTGDWPTNLSKEKIVSMVTGIPDENYSKPSGIYRSMIPEDIVCNHTADILRKAKSLPAEEKFKFLKKWVLPNHEHDSIRLYPNTMEIKKETKSKTEKTPLKYLDSPAMELVKVSHELGKTEELILLVKNIPTEDQYLTHARNAFLVLIYVQQEKDQEASQLLSSFTKYFKNVNERTPVWNRWGELVAIHEALKRPALKEQCKELIGLVSVQPVPEKPVDFVEMRNPDIWIQAMNSIIKNADQSVNASK